MKVIIDKVKIHEVGPLENGTSKAGKEFKTLDFIIAEEREDDMGDIHVSYLQVSCLNQKAERVAAAKLRKGELIRLSLDVYSEPFDAKWYSKVRLIGFKRLEQQAEPVNNSRPHPFEPVAAAIGSEIDPFTNNPQGTIDDLDDIFGTK